MGAAAFMGVSFALGRASLVAIRTELGRTHGMATPAGFHGRAFAGGQMLGPVISGVVVDAFGQRSVFPFAFLIGVIGSIVVIGWTNRWLRRDPAAAAMARFRPRQQPKRIRFQLCWPWLQEAPSSPRLTSQQTDRLHLVRAEVRFAWRAGKRLDGE